VTVANSDILLHGGIEEPHKIPVRIVSLLVKNCAWNLLELCIIALQKKLVRTSKTGDIILV